MADITKKQAYELEQSVRDITEMPETKVSIITGRYYPKNIPDFVMLFQAVTEKIISELSPASAKILLYMLSKLRYSNHIGINQTTIAEETHLSERSVSRSVKELKDLKILIAYKDEQDKRRDVYIINPYTAWKGTFKAQKTAIKLIDANQTSLELPMK